LLGENEFRLRQGFAPQNAWDAGLPAHSHKIFDFAGALSDFSCSEELNSACGA